MVADNSTVTQIDLGEFGGQRDVIAEFKDNSLIVYMKPKDEKVIDMIATRSIAAESMYLIILNQNVINYKNW